MLTYFSLNFALPRYVFETSLTTLVIGITKKSSLDQLELWNSWSQFGALIHCCTQIHFPTIEFLVWVPKYWPQIFINKVSKKTLDQFGSAISANLGTILYMFFLLNYLTKTLLMLFCGLYCLTLCKFTAWSSAKIIFYNLIKTLVK